MYSFSGRDCIFTSQFYVSVWLKHWQRCSGRSVLYTVVGSQRPNISTTSWKLSIFGNSTPAPATYEILMKNEPHATGPVNENYQVVPGSLIAIIGSGSGQKKTIQGWPWSSKSHRIHWALQFRHDRDGRLNKIWQIDLPTHRMRGIFLPHWFPEVHAHDLLTDNHLPIYSPYT